MSVPLSEVRAALPGATLRGADVVVRDAVHDHRQVAPGALFCAIVGARVDGHEHAAAAVEAGAAALLVDRWLDLDVPQCRVPDVRAATGPAAAVVHGRPSEELQLVGVTGTNGKTTVAYLLEAALAAAGTGVGVIGTVETRIHGTAVPGVRTTPEGTDLQRLLREMRHRGVEAVAMEVSSHGLDLHRIDGTRVGVAVYTNLSQDHLDHHGSMEAYLQAKARLFTPALAEQGVVHLDGPWADRLLAGITIPVTTVGRREDADVRIVDVEVDADGGRAVLLGLGATAGEAPVPVRTRLPGAFNLDNAATALVAAVRAGLDPSVAAAGIAACPGAPGRLERVEAGQSFTVLVDYAHTPDAVTNVLDTLRALLAPTARLTIVLGCGGDRDRGKRGPMGAAAAAADLAVLTSDNPRSEDPDAILVAVRGGAERAVQAGAPAAVVVEVDRARAIAAAIAQAGPEDVVLIAGKGHETVQELAGGTVPFDDRVVAADAIRARDDTTAGTP
ncbi:MAG: UDP-N-acetylmuramoyl-L-alanyl-D-glutamate--2,6-diaminopimelate ligase [Nitriliruptoraceae bacterium]|nr:UDP-N-acetylmuramoyl-L-alanyl-D-glutamate--2,6-diaminopimelate ligase [Nitriliruptoraceae bacterium]